MDNGLGQRTGEEILNSAWRPEELQLMEDAGVTMEEVVTHWIESKGVDTLNAAIGTVCLAKQRLAEEVVSEAPQAPAPVEGDLTTPPTPTE